MFVAKIPIGFKGDKEVPCNHLSIKTEKQGFIVVTHLLESSFPSNNFPVFSGLFSYFQFSFLLITLFDEQCKCFNSCHWSNVSLKEQFITGTNNLPKSSGQQKTPELYPQE